MVSNNSSIGNSIFATVAGSLSLTVIVLALLFFEVGAGIVLISAIVALGYIGIVSKNAKFGYYIFSTLSFAFPSIELYLGVSQFGVILDSILFVTVLTLLFKILSEQNSELGITRFKSFWIWVLWILFSLLIQVINSENVNWLSFIYGIRRQHLNPLGIILLNILVIKTKRDFRQALVFHLVGAILLALIAERQFFLGFNSFENNLLQTPFGKTHLLPGITRYWGGFTDAASSGVGLSLMIIGLIPSLINRQIMKYPLLSFLCFVLFLHAGLLSGTRSAYASFAAGVAVVTFMYVRQRMQLFIILLGSIFYSALRFTSIGDSYTIIRRIRSGFNSEDASLLVRIANRVKLDDWLLTHPFGAGIGSASFDKRFAPDSFMATFPPDGLYVLIKSELGYPGQLFFNTMMASIGCYLLYRTFKAHAFTDTKLWMATFLALFIAARVSDYAQMITFQFPLVNLLFFTLVAFEKFEKWPSVTIFKPKVEAPFR